MKCEICGADPMTANCNGANCDTGKPDPVTDMFEEMGIKVVDATPKTESAMTNYNERLDEILELLHNSWLDDDYDAKDPDATEAKQALTSLIKELVVEAKPMVASKEVIETYLQNGMTQKAAEYHGRNHAVDQFEQNLLKALEEM